LDLSPKKEDMLVSVCSVTKKKRYKNFLCFNINKSVMLLLIMGDMGCMDEEAKTAM
jgi:hypothetical protein